MKRIFSAILLLCLTFGLTQCKKNADIDNNIPAPITSDPITATLKGNVFNENNLPVSGAVIKVGTMTVTTDATGYFRINGAALDKQASLVKVEKPGYFSAYRVFAATAGANQVTIKLLPKIVAGTINAGSGGQVTLPAGGKVTFAPNGIVTATGGADYSGTVKVYASYIDPTASDIGATIPGSFMGDDKDGKRVSLASFGMMAVELQSASGEKLQIRSGTTASLIIPIPASRVATAPATISLWYVDEATGLWKEEGTATKVGNQYQGDVKHFSFWNCDYSMPSVLLSMTILSTNAQPVIHGIVRLTNLDGVYNSYSYGVTDSLGHVSGLVPVNAHLRMEILSDCYEVISTQDIGPFSANTDLGNVTVTGATSMLMNIHGLIVDCSNAAVTNGTAEIIYNGVYHYSVSTDATGHFSFNIMLCTGTLTIDVIPIDHIAQQEGPSTTVSLSPGNTDLGSLVACGTSSVEFVNYTLDGTNYSYDNSNPNGGIAVYDSTFNLHTLYAFGNGNNGVNISFIASAAGVVPVSSLYLNGVWANIGLSTISLTLTNYPNSSSGYFEGNFSGTFIDTNGVMHSLVLSFRAR